MAHFEVSFSWEVEDGVDETLVVSGEIDRSRGSRRGNPDNWTAPWVQIDDIEIRNEKGQLIPADISGRLLDQNAFLEEVEALAMRA